MSDFENDIRRKQELKGRPFADNIYYQNFGMVGIKRYDKIDNLVIDQQFAIDVTIIMDNGMVLNGQEKFLSYNYSKYNSLTVEFMQDPLTDEKGDWFKLAPQFYLCAYFNEAQTDFIKYILIYWPKLVIHTNNNVIDWRLNVNNNGRAKASFKWINFNNIPDDCIIAKKLTE